MLCAPESGVIARSDRTQRARAGRGVAIYATSRVTLLRDGWFPDSYRNTIPLRGFRLIAANGFFAAWARC